MSNEYELYKEFLVYAMDSGVDLDYVQQMYDLYCETEEIHAGAEYTVNSFEALMYEFMGVQSFLDDERLFYLLEAPSIYEINHPNNFN